MENDTREKKEKMDLEQIQMMEEESPFYRYDETDSGFFRIPALITLENGDVMAAIDARYSGVPDSPANLDTAINFKRISKGENFWRKPIVINNFLDYPNRDSARDNSASFIDTSILQATVGLKKGRIYMITDAWPYGTGLMHDCGGHSYPGSGMYEIDGVHCFGLTLRDARQFSVWPDKAFDHYLIPNSSADVEEHEKYRVCRLVDGSVTEYTADGHFNLYRNGEALTVLQKESDIEIPMNIFYEESIFKIFHTCYVWLIYSDDNGETWSDPKIIGAEFRKPEGPRFLGVAPGRGLEVSKGAFAGRLLFPLYEQKPGEPMHAITIYSDDGDTWTLGKPTVLTEGNNLGMSSESQLVELPDGAIRMFTRGYGKFVGYADSIDGGVTWSPMQEDKGLKYCGDCMISVINYSRLIDEKKVLLSSMPEGEGRNNGILRVGLIEEYPKEHDTTKKYTVDWKYAYPVNGKRTKKGVDQEYVYSCLTELKDGRVALLYEQKTNSEVKGENPAYAVFSLDKILQ